MRRLIYLKLIIKCLRFYILRPRCVGLVGRFARARRAGAGAGPVRAGAHGEVAHRRDILRDRRRGVRAACCRAIAGGGFRARPGADSVVRAGVVAVPLPRCVHAVGAPDLAAPPLAAADGRGRRGCSRGLADPGRIVHARAGDRIS